MSDDFVGQLIYTYLLFTVNSALQTCRRKSPEETNLESEGAREGVPFFLSNDQKTHCPERHK
jgi:hypothetical protein